jgi:Tol biopolymer transport system component
MGPRWSPPGDAIVFSIGTFAAFYRGLDVQFRTREDRMEGGAQIAIIHPDGTGFRELTSGAENKSFPSMAPDGKQVVYRSFGRNGGGLRVLDIDRQTERTLTNGYDNFPVWSPRGDLIAFSRQVDGNFEIFTIKPDGGGLRQLTHARGNDAHVSWSPDGEWIVFGSERMGFKDEGIYTDAPQPYGELFVMRYDGSQLQQLTDNQWEEGAPTWVPHETRPLTDR